MRLGTVFVGLTILAGLCGGLTGCSGAPPGTDAEIKKPLTEEQLKAENAKIREGMKTGAGYQGAPGAPAPK
jgi:hypothetical protein